MIRHDKARAVQAGPGAVRWVLAHSPAMMLVKYTFAAGTLFPMHQHPHEQLTYVQQGELQLTCGGEQHILRDGDSCLVPGGVPHGVVALTDAVVLDTFTPAREDFLAQE